MGFLQQGRWHGSERDQVGAKGWEPRVEQFRRPIGGSAPEDGELPVEAGRYGLNLCPGCLLSHRTAILHRLKRLADVVPVSTVRPSQGRHAP